MTPRQSDWFKTAISRGMNLDQVADYQCVDVPNDYAEYIFGNWERTIGRGHAKDKYSIAPGDYWLKIPNNPSDANQTPAPGDVIVWGAMRNNPYGHIAVVVSASVNYVTVIEQNGFESWKPAYQKIHPYYLYGALPTGWLRPRPDKIIGGTESGTIPIEEHHKVLVRTIMDGIEGNPHYESKKAKAFAGHVARLANAKDPLEERRLLKDTMHANGVLNAPSMKAHLAQDKANLEHYEEQTREMTLVIDGLELQVNRVRAERDIAQEALEKAQSENTQQSQALEAQTKDMGQLRATVAEQAQTITTLKEAAKASDPVAALSGIELIRLGLRKWLQIGGDV